MCFLRNYTRPLPGDGGEAAPSGSRSGGRGQGAPLEARGPEGPPLPAGVAAAGERAGSGLPPAPRTRLRDARGSGSCRPPAAGTSGGHAALCRPPGPPLRPASTQYAPPSAPSPQTASGASRHPPAFAALVPRWGLPRPAWSGRLPPRPLPIPGLPPPCGWASCPPPPGRCLLPHGRPLQEAEGREGRPWAREPGREVSADNGNAARGRGDQGFRAPSGSGPGNGVEHSGVRPGRPGSQGRMPWRPGDSARGPGGGPDGAPSCVPDADGEAALPGTRPLETTPRRRPCQHGTPVCPVRQPGMRSVCAPWDARPAPRAAACAHSGRAGRPGPSERGALLPCLSLPLRGDPPSLVLGLSLEGSINGQSENNQFQTLSVCAVMVSLTILISRAWGIFLLNDCRLTLSTGKLHARACVHANVCACVCTCACTFVCVCMYVSACMCAS